jgi:hypothetical protein
MFETDLFHQSRRAFQCSGLTLIGASFVGPVCAQTSSINEVIDNAGRMRMLSQRMAKAWLALGQAVEGKRAKKILLESIARFSQQIIELKRYAPSNEIKDTYAALEPVWADYKTALLGQAPAKGRTLALFALDAKVLKLAHQGTLQLERYSGKTTGQLVNIAGRQRMLSQRAAKLFLSQTWGTGSPDQSKELGATKREFAAVLRILAQAPEATDSIKLAVELAAQQWIFFDNALNRMNEPDPQGQHAAEVFASSENILQVMDKVTGMYARLV